MSALRRIRLDARLSIEELATRADVSADQIRNIENGRVGNPRAGTLGKLADALDVEPSELDPFLTARAATDTPEAA